VNSEKASVRATEFVVGSSLLPRGMGGAKGDLVCCRSVDGQGLGATGAAARATEVAAIAGGRLHKDVEASSSRDHRRCNVGCELRTADHRGGEGSAVEDYNGGGNEMAAGGGEDEARRQLREGHGAWRNRAEARFGTGAPAEGIQRVAPGQQREDDQPPTKQSNPAGRRHNSVTHR
jgi:hypothetical protein